MRWKLPWIGLIAAFAFVSVAQDAGYTIERRAVKLGSRLISATIVRASRDRFRLGVSIANGLVGGAASLASMASRAKAVCAINGTFLAAYEGQTGEPYGTLAVGGKWLHLGSAGTRLDVLDDGSIRFSRDDLRVLGSLDGSVNYPNNWYAYGINQSPQNANSSYVFTPERGSKLGFRAPFAAIVRNGFVVRVAKGEDAQIPTDGFVIALSGNEIDQLGSRLTVGRGVAYRVDSRSGQPLNGVQYSLGAGPKLVTGGAISLNLESEGFRSSKILSERGARSAVGLNATELILATITDATVRDEAAVMGQLGATDAMNLDGGASSALWCGEDIVVGGRKVPNALVLWKK